LQGRRSSAFQKKFCCTCLIAFLELPFLLNAPVVKAAPLHSPIPTPTIRHIHLVASSQFLEAMRGRIPAVFQVIPKARLNSQELLNCIERGDSLVWIGNDIGLPKELWIGTFRPATAKLSVGVAKDSPLPLGPLAFNQSTLTSAYLRPTVSLPYHNIVEEPRADLLPIFEARDRFGQITGYPGVLMRYYAPSLVGHHFGGSDCFLFFFDHPNDAMSAVGWERLLQAIMVHFSSGIEIRRVQTDFASYRVGERVNIRVRIGNIRPRAVAAELYFYAKGPGEKGFHVIGRVRRCPEGDEEAEAVFEFLPGKRPGLWNIRVEAREDLNHAEELAIQGNPVPIDRRECGFVILGGPISASSFLKVEGPSLRIDGRNSFWTGTNYYPSSSWWDWLWRDFRPLKASEDFTAMRRTGYRIVRMWVDPVLDEQSLRALDAAIYLAAQHGITLDICIFTQWVRWIGFERPDGQRVYFDFRDKDFNVYGISLRNLALQREYVQRLAKRWRDAGNIIYDLSNETGINDPDPSQMGSEALAWKGVPKSNGTLRDSLLFRHWAQDMTRAIREAGGNQPVIPGDLFTAMGYGDAYLGQRDGDIESWHSYENPEAVGESLSYVDPGCSGRPLLLEEFGTVGWNHANKYDAMAHFALAAGATAAMSYEWGVSWLAPEMSYYPTPLRQILEGKPDPRWFKAAIALAQTWSVRSPGIFPAPSGFQYGSIFSGTPFPASAARALGRLGIINQDLGRAIQPEKTYVVIPTAAPGERAGMGTIEETIRQLWKQKALFGIWQEDCLDRLPKSTQVLIAPAAVSSELETRLKNLSHHGIKVFVGKNNNWMTSPLLTRLSVTPASAELVVRRTREGSLYFLFSNARSAQPATLKTERHEIVSLGLENYALVHERASGIGLIEASGDVSIDGAHLCRIEGGRAIIQAIGSASLQDGSKVRVIATGPMRIQFDRPIHSVTVLEPGFSRPLATFSPRGPDNPAIDIDSEMARYIVEVDFAEH